MEQIEVLNSSARFLKTRPLRGAGNSEIGTGYLWGFIWMGIWWVLIVVFLILLMIANILHAKQKKKNKVAIHLGKNKINTVWIDLIKDTNCEISLFNEDSNF